MGGGVVAEIFSDLQAASRFSGGGGSSRIFLGSPEAVAIQWGGGSAIHKKGAPFCFLGDFQQGGPSLSFLGFLKGGARAPRAAPLNRPLNGVIAIRAYAILK